MSERPFARRIGCALIAMLHVAGCASAPAPRDPGPLAREAQCRDRMYIERSARGRGAVNWNVYDLCMREGG